MAAIAGTGSDNETIHTAINFDDEPTRVASAIIAAFDHGSISSKKIALQFPDELLAISADVCRRLLGELTSRLAGLGPAAPPSLYILADTTFGSCCADEVAAAHVAADMLVHYGRSCLSRTSRLPVLYVFGRSPIDAVACANAVSAALQDGGGRHVLLMFDVQYHHAREAVAAELTAASGARVVVATIDDGVNRPGGAGEVASSSSGRAFRLPEGARLNEFTILYVGPQSLTLTNIVMTHSRNEVYSYDPTTKELALASSSANRLLMRRYALVQKARDADVIGIVVGTLGVVSYLPTIEHIKRLILAKGKKPYVISVGKPNPAKLGNFLEIDVFVLVACSENSFLDSKEFLRPIVTPYELQVALADADWGPSASGEYITDLVAVLDRVRASADAAVAAEEAGDSGDDDDADGEAHFSLATGKLKHHARYAWRSGGAAAGGASQDAPAEGQLVVRPAAGEVSTFVVSSAAADFLNHRRTYRGLDIEAEADVALAVDGRAGIASSYGEGTPSEKA